MTIKARLFLTSLKLTRLSLRLFGWTDKPKPDGFKHSPTRPFWRWHPENPKHIETASFYEAVNTSIRESRKKC